MAVPAGARSSSTAETLRTAEEGVSSDSRHVLPTGVVDGEKLVSVLIDLADASLASYDGGIPGLAATSPRVTGAERLEVDTPAARAYTDYLDGRQRAFANRLRQAVPAARVTGEFQAVIGGVSAMVPPNEFEAIEALPGVRGVYLDEPELPQTERSNEFIGADGLWTELGGQQQAGEGVVVGVLDTGIWPEHPSLSDPDPAGNSYPAPPGGPYACEFGSSVDGDEPFACNNKLIGAYRFMSTYDVVVGLLPTEFESARDDNGHGTHTATTAAGNGGVAASIFGVDRGAVSGVAPRAHVIAYKVCGEMGCYQTDSVAAVQQAIIDGVDVINFSIGGGATPYSDAVSLAFLDAYEAGVLVSASAGNSGPGPETVGHREPWTLTVGSSTSDRHFLATVSLTADDGSTLEVSGASVTAAIETPTPIVLAGGDGQCTEDMPAVEPEGAVVVCDRGVFARVTKGFNAMNAGAGGMVLRNLDPAEGLSTDNHYMPSAHVDAAAGQQVVEFLAEHTGVEVTSTPGLAATVQGDKMASSSSRGGPGQTLGISKPDVTAPGVQILAGNTPQAALGGSGGMGPHGELFQSIDGTSMSSPHAAGAAALLRAAHPDWTPGQIKSALMLSAQTAGVTKEDGATPVGPFDAGSGRIRPTAAAAVPVTMDETAANYVALQGNLWEANYPSVYIPGLGGSITVERTVSDALGTNTPLKLRVLDAGDLRIGVPKTVPLARGGQASFSIEIDARDVPDGQVRHATLELSRGSHRAQMPITIVRDSDQPVSLTNTCDASELTLEETTDCTITIRNNEFEAAEVSLVDRLPRQLGVVPGSVEGAELTGNTLRFDGTLDGNQVAEVDVALDPLASPFGYVGLAGFASTDVGAGDETITNFNVPAFTYAGQTYTRVGVVSNGYIVVGGGTAGDVTYINQALPDATPPNNVLAPYWTDIDVSAGGRVLINTLTDGVDSWIVVEWEEVANWSNPDQRNTAQVWIRYTGGDEDVSFTYGPRVDGADGGWLTVGAENSFGNAGGMVHFDGQGPAPTPSNSTGYEVKVASSPGSASTPHEITFTVVGRSPGAWTNHAQLSSDALSGVNTASFSGVVTEGP